MNDLHGPAAAWGEFYVEHRRALAVYAMSLVGNRADAADLVQDVLTNMVRRRCSPRNAKAFVMRALRNRAIDLRRRNGAPRRSDEPSQEPPRAAWIGAAAESVEAREAALGVRAALDGLSGEQREVVVLRVYGDMTFREIAEALECPLGTVTSHYARAISMLRACMDAAAENGRGEGGAAAKTGREKPQRHEPRGANA